MIADVFAPQLERHQPHAGISVTSADMLRRSLPISNPVQLLTRNTAQLEDFEDHFLDQVVRA
jgi:hypothetical protein